MPLNVVKPRVGKGYIDESNGQRLLCFYIDDHSQLLELL